MIYGASYKYVNSVNPRFLGSWTTIWAGHKDKHVDDIWTECIATEDWFINIKSLYRSLGL